MYNLPCFATVIRCRYNLHIDEANVTISDGAFVLFYAGDEMLDLLDINRKWHVRGALRGIAGVDDVLCVVHIALVYLCREELGDALRAVCFGMRRDTIGVGLPPSELYYGMTAVFPVNCDDAGIVYVIVSVVCADVGKDGFGL